METLSEKLTPLREACLNFESQAKTLSMRRKSTSLVLARHTKLLEVLELPQLVETCVRNGHYDEALELTQYATRYVTIVYNSNIGIFHAGILTVHSALKSEKRCNFKSTKTHYLHFQKWQKINFCTRKKFKIAFLVVLNFFLVQKLIFCHF